MTSAKASLSQHRKKKYVFKEREAPFPVPIASITRETPSKNYWHHYTGQIQGDHVLVIHTGDISYLNRMGYFGRGLMSRGAPAVHKDLPYVHVPSARSEEPDIVHVMRRRLYLKHMKWKKANDIRLSSKESTGYIDSKFVDPEDEEFDSDVEYFHPEYVPGDDRKSNIVHSGPGSHLNTASVRLSVPNNSSPVNGIDISEQQSNTVVLGTDSANQSSSLWSWNEESPNQNASDGLCDNTTSNQNAATDAWDKMEADEDFWTSENVSDDKNKPKENGPPGQGEHVYNNSDMCSIQTKRDKRDHDDCDSSHRPQVKRIKLSGESDNNSNTDTTDYTNNQSLQQSQTCIDDGSKSKHEVNESNSVTNETKVAAEPNEVLEEDGNEIVERTAVDVHKEEKTKENVKNEDRIEKNNEKMTLDGCGNVEKLSDSHTDQGKMDTNKSEPLPIHPYCRYGDDDEEEEVDVNGKTAVAGDEYLVIDDSDIDDSTELGHRKKKYTWIPVRKKEVFNFNEPLMLSFEEAYFLCYGLGCLTVQDENQIGLTLTKLWCRFCNKQEFLPRYVAYHYFRSKGWVPKPSLLFGTDFLVYKVGPEFYHASYSVIVKTVYEGSFEEVEGYNNRKLTWTSFFGLNRVTEHVAKTLVYCYVIMPRDLTDEERKSPECISKFKVRLQTVQRWVSSQERDKEKIIDDITQD